MKAFNSTEFRRRHARNCAAAAFVAAASASTFGATILSETFEGATLDPRLSIQTVGGYVALPGVQGVTDFGSTKAFGFGLSNCRFDCFLDR